MKPIGIIAYKGIEYKVVDKREHKGKGAKEEPATAYLLESMVKEVNDKAIGHQEDLQETLAELIKRKESTRKKKKSHQKKTKNKSKSGGWKTSATTTDTPSDLKDVGKLDSAKLRYGTPCKEWPTNIIYVGFDSEWHEVEDGVVKHRDGTVTQKMKRIVLSYQLSYIYGGKMYTWILLPKNGYRYTLSYIMGWFFSDTRSAGMPVVDEEAFVYITMFAHYGIVDYSVFADKSKLLRNLDSVRRSLSTIEKPYSFKVTLKAGSGKVTHDCSLTVRDTMHLSPNGSSLESLGLAMGIPKLSLPDGYSKSAMDKLLLGDMPAYMCYAARDSEIALLWGYTAIEKITAKVPTTLGSAAAKHVVNTICNRNNWTVEEFNLKWRGMETIRTQVQVGEHLRTVKQTIVSDEASGVVTSALHAFYGGRNECFLVGPQLLVPGKDKGLEWNDFDLAGAYPTAMSLIPDPDFENIEIIKGVLTPDIVNDPFAYLFGLVQFEFPRRTKYPCIPVKDMEGRGLIFPLKGRAFSSAPEIYLALRMGAKVEFVQCGFLMGSRRVNDKPVYSLAEAMRKLVLNRMEAEALYGKKSPEALAAKEKANSVYGKLAQGTSNKRSYSTRWDKYSDTEPSNITSSPQAALTTALVRAVVSAAMHQLGRMKYKIASVTTDGFLTNAPLEVLDSLELFGFTEKFRQSRKFLVNMDTVWEVKHKAKSLVMMKTRGGYGVGKVGNFNLPSAGAGYKPGELESGRVLDGLEVSEAAAVTYLERKGKLKFKYVALPSAAAYVRKDADGIGEDVEKSVGWEYDYKRKPNQCRNVCITIGGKTYRHVSYDTVPWETIDDFAAARDRIDNIRYPIKTCRFLKRAADEIKFRADTFNENVYLRGGLEYAKANQILRAIRTGRVTGPLCNLPKQGILATLGSYFAIELTENHWKHAADPDRSAKLSMKSVYDEIAALGLTIAPIIDEDEEDEDVLEMAE